MTSTHLPEAIRARLAEIDEERTHLLALLKQYTRAEANGSGAPSVVKPAPGPSHRRNKFKPRAKGPTERILAVVAEHSGLTYGEVVRHAVEGMDTTAGNPKRSLGSTLGSLVKRGKITRQDGRYYPVG